jgi:hypothetical protein
MDDAEGLIGQPYWQHAKFELPAKMTPPARGKYEGAAATQVAKLSFEMGWTA